MLVLLENDDLTLTTENANIARRRTIISSATSAERIQPVVVKTVPPSELPYRNVSLVVFPTARYVDISGKMANSVP